MDQINPCIGNAISDINGPPLVLNYICIEYGSGDQQLTKSIDGEKYFAEIDYLWGNEQLGFGDFAKLLTVIDSWDIKRSAYSYIRSNSKLGRVKWFQGIALFKFETIKLPIALFKNSLH